MSIHLRRRESICLRPPLPVSGGSMALRARVILLLTLIEAGCGAARLPAPSTAPPAFAVHSIALPGAPPGGVGMDYLAYDRARHRVWVPAGNTGSVDVVDAQTGQVTRIEGFPTAEVERRGQKRTVGPSSATVCAGEVFVGNSGTSLVYELETSSLA